MKFGDFAITRTRLFAIVTLILAVLIWMNVSVAGLPLVPLALVAVSIALLW